MTSLARFNSARWKSAPERLFGAASILLVLFCVGGAAFSISREGLDASAAAWVQAGGSIAAVAGAAWLFGADARRQRRARREERQEVAWGVRFALIQAKSECNTIAFEIAGPEAMPKESDLRHWRLRTAVSQTFLQSFVTRTDHVHPAIIHIATNGIALLEQLDDDLQEVRSHLSSGAKLPEQLVSDITWYIGHFDQLILALDERMRGVMLALDQGRDMLPAEKFDVWRSPPNQPEK